MIRDWWKKATPQERDDRIGKVLFGYDPPNLEYSTNSAVALEHVVEKMREKAPNFSLVCGGPTWSASFDGVHGLVTSAAPEAICIAALMALEKWEEDAALLAVEGERGETG